MIGKLLSPPNQPGWDIRGTSPDGEDIFVQVKTGTKGYSDDVLDAMQDSPDVTFAVGNEIYGRISEAHPELVNRLIEIQSNEGLTESVNDGLKKLAENHGIDMPDSLAEALPFVAEAALVMKIIQEATQTERDLADVSMIDKLRVQVVKVSKSVSRFFINRGSMAVGAALGDPTVIGVGLFAGMKLNDLLKYPIEQAAIRLVGGNSEEMFYLMNKVEIDQLGQSFATTQVA